MWQMQKIHNQLKRGEGTGGEDNACSRAIILLSQCNKKIRAMASRRNEKPVQKTSKKKEREREKEAMQNTQLSLKVG